MQYVPAHASHAYRHRQCRKACILTGFAGLPHAAQDRVLVTLCTQPVKGQCQVTACWLAEGARRQGYLVTHDVHLVQLPIVVDKLLKAARHCHLQPTKLLHPQSASGGFPLFWGEGTGVEYSLHRYTHQPQEHVGSAVSHKAQANLLMLCTSPATYVGLQHMALQHMVLYARCNTKKQDTHWELQEVDMCRCIRGHVPKQQRRLKQHCAQQ